MKHGSKVDTPLNRGTDINNILTQRALQHIQFNSCVPLRVSFVFCISHFKGLLSALLRKTAGTKSCLRASTGFTRLLFGSPLCERGENTVYRFQALAGKDPLMTNKWRIKYLAIPNSLNLSTTPITVPNELVNTSTLLHKLILGEIPTS